MRFPEWRARWARAERSRDTTLDSVTLAERATSDLPSFCDHRRELFVFGVIYGVGVFIIWERAFFDFLHVLRDPGHGHFRKFGIAFSELRLEIGAQTKKLAASENLPVAADARAD